MLGREIIRRLEHSEEFSEPHTGQKLYNENRSELCNSHISPFFSHIFYLHREFEAPDKKSAPFREPKNDYFCIRIRRANRLSSILNSACAWFLSQKERMERIPIP